MSLSLRVFISVFGDGCRETALFEEMFDKFFDESNVSNCSSSIKSLKPFEMPYRSVGDF